MSKCEEESKNVFAGRWTREEEVYTDALIHEFRAGNLEDVEEGATLRNFLADAVACHPKRISKKYEGTEYNGRQQFWRNIQAIPEEEAKERQERLEDLKRKFEESRSYSIERANKLKHKKRLRPSFLIEQKAAVKAKSAPKPAPKPVKKQERSVPVPAPAPDNLISVAGSTVNAQAKVPVSPAVVPTQELNLGAFADASLSSDRINSLLSAAQATASLPALTQLCALTGAPSAAPNQVEALLQLAGIGPGQLLAASQAPAGVLQGGNDPLTQAFLQRQALTQRLVDSQRLGAQLQILQGQQQHSSFPNMDLQRALAGLRPQQQQPACGSSSLVDSLLGVLAGGTSNLNLNPQAVEQLLETARHNAEENRKRELIMEALSMTNTAARVQAPAVMESITPSALWTKDAVTERLTRALVDLEALGERPQKRPKH